MTTAGPLRPGSGPISRCRRVLFVLVATVCVLLLAEVAIRLGRAPLHFGSFRELRLDMMKRNYPAEPHPALGYAPRPNFASRDNHWGTLVSIDQDGLRRNGAEPPPGARCIVAVGDSFTFGDQVDDADSWPAQLEVALQQPVKNGGVFGYSLAQAVLRAELLMERWDPTTVVVSFVPDDLTRCEFSRRYVPLPWFDLHGEGLRLQPPSVGGEDSAAASARAWKDFLGRSALVDAVFAHTRRAWWYENDKQVAVPHLVGKGGEIGKRLITRLAERCRARGVRLLVALQGDVAVADATAVLSHARSGGVETLDLVQGFRTAAAVTPSLHAEYFAGHMTRAGNAWVAAQIADVLRAAPR